MNVFKITIENLEWIDGKEDNPDDLCLHGDAVAKIGEEIFRYNATVSATALYLLKTLTQDHIMNEDNQMLPCCGHFMIPDNDLTNVDICGCPNGIDWTVLHDKDRIKIITESGRETTIHMEEYQKEVFRFADKIEDFYNKCSPKNLSNEYDRDCYYAFWNEWHRRRGKCDKNEIT